MIIPFTVIMSVHTSKTLAPAALKYVLQIMCYYTKHVNCHYQNIVCKQGVVHKERLQTYLCFKNYEAERILV